MGWPIASCSLILWRHNSRLSAGFAFTYPLSALLGRLPRGVHVMLTNAQRNRLKLLFWDGSGLWVCSKRLEKGRFRWPAAASEATKVTVSHEELTLLLGGIDLAQTRRRAWHRVAVAA
jgi:transposase